MKKFLVWSVCLLAWIVGVFGACAEDVRYDELCAGSEAQRENVTAWLEIPGAGICEPVMQHPEDDAFYSKHDPAGAESGAGAVYTQATYNAADFSDPVTVIYGTGSVEDAAFRDLQEIYSGRFDECRTILLHTPEGTAEYEVFAAVPYTALHILHYYDFSVERRFNSFIDGIYSMRVLGMHLVEEDRPESGEKLLILSTGLRGDKMQRYLVLARPARQ